MNLTENISDPEIGQLKGNRNIRNPKPIKNNVEEIPTELTKK